MPSQAKRSFLLLQGPHGPFFSRLGRMLARAGCDVWRVGFNAADRFFWHHKPSYIPANRDDWENQARKLMRDKQITDIILYGDTRDNHETAVRIAKSLGITIHVFEEGYLRPFWVTYERGGSNGNSRLMEMSIAEMRAALNNSNLDVPEAPAHWGEMGQHVFYGFLYHFVATVFSRNAWNFQTHNTLPIRKELMIYLRRYLLTPWLIADRFIRTVRIKNGGYPYHLVLMQLEHDAAFQKHSPFDNMADFLETVIEGFAAGAPRHHHLVFKAHPLESLRRPFRKIVRQLAQKHGLADRVHYVPGGKLAQLLDHARTAITVNSTAAQQVLWRGLPLKIFGDAVYDKPEFVSTAPIDAFFSAATRPDNRAYQDYRRYLLETSQIAGGFYSIRGRRQLLRQVVDMVLSHKGPYAAFKAGELGPQQKLSLVKGD